MYKYLLLLLISFQVNAGEVLVTWTNEDINNITHTRIYYDECSDGDEFYRMGQAQGVWPEIEEVIIPLPPGQWCIQVRHVLTDYTEVIVKQVCAGEIPKHTPRPPTLLAKLWREQCLKKYEHILAGM